MKLSFMTSLKSLLFITLMCLATNIAAQVSDGGLWLGVEAEYKVNKKIDLSAELQNRLRDNMRRYKTSLIDLGVKYDFSDYLSGYFTYRIGHRLDDEGLFTWRERFNTDLKLKVPVNDVRIDFRVRYQAGSRNPEERIADYRRAMRYRIKVRTKIAKKTKGAIVGEIYQGRRSGDLMVTDWRLRAEVRRKLSKGEYITIGYMLQREANRANPLLEHIIRVSYAFRIN